MLIFWYLTRRFLAYVFGISLMLAFLFNFVEFFEKLLRVQHATVGTIIHFISLNFIPAFFDLLPIGVWLATCLVLKDLFASNEWELLQLLIFVPKRFFVFLLAMGMVVSTSALLVQEAGVAHLAFQAEHFRQEKFKQGSGQKVVNRWFDLDDNLFCYCGMLDLTTNQGKDLLIISMSPDFHLKKIVNAPDFSVNPATSMILVPTSTVFDADNPGVLAQADSTFWSPGFFSQINLGLEEPTLGNLGRKIIFHRRILPSGVYNELLGQFYSRLGYYLQILLYPLITFCLFMCTHHPYTRWVLMLSAYPITLLAGTIGNAAFNHGFAASIILLPYLIMIVIAILARIKMFS